MQYNMQYPFEVDVGCKLEVNDIRLILLQCKI